MNKRAVVLALAAFAAGRCALGALQSLPKGGLPDPAGLAINAGR